MNEGFLLGILGANVYFFFKIGMIFSLAPVVQDKLLKAAQPALTAFILAWMIVQGLQTGILLGLSVFRLLYPPFFLALVLGFTLFFYWRAHHLSFLSNSWFKNSSEKILYALIVITLGCLWLRSLFLPDLTWDAQTYGLPRLAFWLQAKSVFITMPTQQLNIFVNEWNAELNSLAYALASGSYIGFNFGNLEILTVFCLAVIWVASLLGAPMVWALSLSAILGSSPAILGLASTIKGDLLSCVASLLALGCLLKIARGSDPMVSFLFLILSIALAIGSKMSVLLLAVVLFGMGCLEIWKYRTQWREILGYEWFGFIALLGCFLSRFWLNGIQYGHPLKRVEIETVQFNVRHFLGHFKLLVEKVFNVSADLHGPRWALAAGMNLSVWFIVLMGFFIPFFFIFRKKQLTVHGEVFEKKQVMVIILIVIAFIFSMMLSPAYPWSFRYFMSPLLLLLLVFGCFFSNVYKNKTILTRLMVILSIVVVGVQLFSMFKWGEVFPAGNWSMLKHRLIEANTPLKRTFLGASLPSLLVPIKALDLDGKSSKRILIFNDINHSLSPFIGSYAQNAISLVSSAPSLLLQAGKKTWDFVVIAQWLEFRKANLLNKLVAQGYTLLVNNAIYIIAAPAQRVKLTPLKKMKDFSWTYQGNNNAISFKPLLTLNESNSRFLTQPLDASGTVLIKARYEGEITAGDWATANLSLFGEEAFHILARGKYKSSETFYSVVDMPEGARLTFSLANWGGNRDNIRLIDVELFSFEKAHYD